MDLAKLELKVDKVSMGLGKPGLLSATVHVPCLSLHMLACAALHANS